MKVSVLIPVISGQVGLLAATLESLRVQDHPEREALVLDASGEEATARIVLAAADAARPRRLEVPTATRTGEILNRGLDQAQGVVLACLVPGERYHPGALALAAGYFARRPDCRALYGESYELHEDNTVRGPRKTGPWELDRLRGDCFFIRPAVFWRREVLADAGTFDEELDGDAADYDFWLRVGREAGFDYLAGCLLGAGWVVDGGHHVGPAELLAVARRHAAPPGTTSAESAAAVLAWVCRLARWQTEQTNGGPEPATPGILRRRFRRGCAGRVLLAAAEIGVGLDDPTLVELDESLREVGL